MTNLNYTFTKKTRNITFGLMAIGLITIIAGFITDTVPEEEGYHHTRVWANLLVNSYFFMGIGLLATFFMALQYVAEVAWSVAVKRVYEAVSCYLPVGAIIMFLLLLAGQFHLHSLYEWMEPHITSATLPDGSLNPHFDEALANKQVYFAPWFFWLRTSLYLSIWCWFQYGFRKRSIEEDLQDGTAIHYKNMSKGAMFLVFFAVTSSTSAWDWMMSLDVHWFSTMYGWYAFSGMWISAMVTIILFVLFLKRKGYLPQVNDSHIHDLGKWVFAVSFLWSYLYFCQFMLIWYTNIPEEIIYFQDRLHNYGYMTIMWTVFFMNFLFPMILLMSRDAKRNYFFLTTVGCIIFAGHWLDVFMMVMPGTVHGNWHLSWLEIGTALGFLGLILFVIHRALTKAPLMIKNHPYLDESIHHHF
ncbi:MAG: quinol:cytochrome C oxidoreductase [Bacteroidetes bacterium RIFCSPLOWO2_12_FULL_35_15]|nr:MAG: quinol:cytochrome C oxidoreductase [Bacteroidetes bacterium RIFCSPLOWO2_12_FULL_35_15]